MVSQKKTDLSTMAMGVPLFSGVDPTYRSLRNVLQLCERGFIQHPDNPPIGLHLFRRKQLPMPAPKRLRQLLQEGFIVNGLATEDFIEVVVQQLTTITLNSVYERRFDD